MDLSLIFKSNLALVMRERGITRAELARRCGAARPWASRLLNNVGMGTTLSTVKRVSEAVGIPAHVLLDPDFAGDE